MSLPKQSFGFNNGNNNGDDRLPIKLVIYDFDQTITRDHLYYELDGGQEDSLNKMSDDKLLKVFGGKERKERLNEHFKRIATNSEIAIISFGWVNVIKLALERMGLNKYFENSIIIGKDSEELKTAGSKAKCIYRMKKKRNLKSDQVIFIDDDNQNIQKAMSYSVTILIQPRNGMTDKHMKEIEEKVGVYPTEESSLKMELSTPTTVNAQKTKDYSYNDNDNNNDNDNKKNENKENKLAKYAIASVPEWFDKLSNPVPDTPVIQIQGDQTPNSDSEYELNVPELNNELANVITINNEEEKQQEDNIDNNNKIEDPNDYEIKPNKSEVINNGIDSNGNSNSNSNGNINSDNANNNDNPH